MNIDTTQFITTDLQMNEQIMDTDYLLSYKEIFHELLLWKFNLRKEESSDEFILSKPSSSRRNNNTSSTSHTNVARSVYAAFFPS